MWEVDKNGYRRGFIREKGMKMGMWIIPTTWIWRGEKGECGSSIGGIGMGFVGVLMV